MNAIGQASNRITGMVSGLDTDSMVKAMIMTQQNKVDKLFYSKTQMEWRKDTLIGFNNQLRKFREENMSVLNGANNLLSANNFKNYKVEMVDGKASSGVSATTVGTAKIGVHTVNSVDQLARGYRFETEDTFTGAGGNGLTTTNVALKNTALGEAFNGKDSIDITINGKDFTFKSTDTVTKMMSVINSSSAGVKLNYSQIDDKFTLEGSETGEGAAAISITKGQELFEAMGMDLSKGIEGQNAKATINGKNIESKTNSITLDGVQFNITREFTSAESVSFSVTNDNQGTVDKIKEFVGKLNTIIKDMYDKYNEKKNYSYNPLTTEQRKELTEEEAKLWDERSRAGIVRRDSNISSFIDSVRMSLYNDVNGLGSLASIGVNIGTYKSGEAPQIEVDEKKLLAALDTDVDRVASMFTATSDSTDYKTKVSESGGFARISMAMETFTSNLNTSTLKNLESNLYDINQKYTEQEKRIYTLSESYYAKFAAMEKSLAAMQSQSSWLTQQLGGTAQ